MARVGERPVSEVLTDIVGNVQEIVRSEMQLAKAEVKAEVINVAHSGTLLAGGAALGFYAVGLLLLTAVLLLSRAMEAWLAALIVFAVVACAAAMLIASGRGRWKKLQPAPEKTIESMKENVSWVKAQIK
jgi:hypothetical protein